MLVPCIGYNACTQFLYFMFYQFLGYVCISDFAVFAKKYNFAVKFDTFS